MANTYTPELKAQVIAGWLAGGSYNGLAKQYDVNKETVRTWVRGMHRGVPPKNEEELDELSDSLVLAAFRACIAVYGQFQDKAWLSRQDADKLAVALGVSFDKLARLVGGYRERERLELEAHTLVHTP